MEVQNFYKNLYSHNPVQDLDLEYLKNETVILDQGTTANLEGEITMQEIEQALNNMKNDKSPGPDGFTAEFYKSFFPEIGVFLVRSLNEAFNRGELSVTQYQGVITCIPKEGKPKQFIKKLETYFIAKCFLQTVISMPCETDKNSSSFNHT